MEGAAIGRRGGAGGQAALVRPREKTKGYGSQAASGVFCEINVTSGVFFENWHK